MKNLQKNKFFSKIGGFFVATALVVSCSTIANADELKGKVFRIAHMGYIEEFDIIVGISCLEKVLAQLGYKFELGTGIKAAEQVFLK